MIDEKQSSVKKHTRCCVPKPQNSTEQAKLADNQTSLHRNMHFPSKIQAHDHEATPRISPHLISSSFLTTRHVATHFPLHRCDGNQTLSPYTDTRRTKCRRSRCDRKYADPNIRQSSTTQLTWYRTNRLLTSTPQQRLHRRLDTRMESGNAILQRQSAYLGG